MNSPFIIDSFSHTLDLESLFCLRKFDWADILWQLNELSTRYLGPQQQGILTWKVSKFLCLVSGLTQLPHWQLSLGTYEHFWFITSSD
jgi:hypothetical protein